VTRILVVDDESKWRDLIRGELEDAGFEVSTAENGEHALDILKDEAPFDLILTDLRMEPVNGLALMRRVRETTPQTDVVMITAYADTQTAIEAMRLGAYDFLIKPFELDELLMMTRRVVDKRGLVAENRALRGMIEGEGGGGAAAAMVGESTVMHRVHELIGKVAATDTTVLIRGESGTGKELVARAIHERSPRASGPFKAVNCAALPETLLESELFGHERGAFTGADRRKLGLFEAASGGTLFLDEIGEISGAVQAKLLRALEAREITRIGSTDSIQVDTRVVTATHVDLEGAIQDGVFRRDLYYRLNVFPLELPPLRQRMEDIESLARRFLAVLQPGEQAPLAAEVMDLLREYDWPGNVRELRNVIERATILAGGAALGPEHIVLPAAAAGEEGESGRVGAGLHLPAEGVNLEDVEAGLIREALERARGNKSQAARLLGITRRALYCRMEKYGITVEGEGAGSG
jgi:DNA-binding NtrC family response regulator